MFFGDIRFLSSNSASEGVELRCPVVEVMNSTAVRIESCPIPHYFIGEKSVGRMYITSTFSTSLLACSEFFLINS
jgi:hypothetical protein